MHETQFDVKETLPDYMPANKHEALAVQFTPVKTQSVKASASKASRASAPDLTAEHTSPSDSQKSVPLFPEAAHVPAPTATTATTASAAKKGAKAKKAAEPIVAHDADVTVHVTETVPAETRSKKKAEPAVDVAVIEAVAPTTIAPATSDKKRKSRATKDTAVDQKPAPLSIADLPTLPLDTPATVEAIVISDDDEDAGNGKTKPKHAEQHARKSAEKAKVTSSF